MKYESHGEHYLLEQIAYDRTNFSFREGIGVFIVEFHGPKGFSGVHFTEDRSKGLVFVNFESKQC